MKAAVWHAARDIRVEDVPRRGPARGEMTIQVAYCGICGSDLHEYTDGPHAVPVGAPHPESGRAAPLVLGHEFCGTVVEVGSGLDTVRTGDRVAVEPHYRCGRCGRCAAGEYNLCDHFGFAGLMGDGGLAEYVTVPGYMAHRLPDSVPFEQAAVLEPAAVALHAIDRAELARTATVAVVGLGSIGLLIVQLAAHLGTGRIIAADPSGPRRELAARLGAHEVVDAGLLPRGAADVTFEVVGAEQTIRDALAGTRKGGRIVLVGLGGEVTVDAFEFVNNEHSLIASVGYRDVYPRLIRLVADGLDLSGIVTSVIPLADVVRDGFDALLGSQEHIKVLVRPCPPTVAT